MTSGPRTLGLLAPVLAAVMAPATALAYFRHREVPAVGGTAQQGPIGPDDIAVTESLGQSVPGALLFTDGYGRKVPLDGMLNRGLPVLLTLGYYHCPQLCGLVHEGLSKAIKGSGLTYGKDFLALSVSIDSKEDVKSANTQRNRLLRALGIPASDAWPFVLDTTPEAAVAKKLADSLGFRFKYDPQSKQFAHTAVAFVLTPEGKISRYLYGVDFPARDFRFALVEASGGRVGTSVDRVLLSCFRYDPLVKRYTPYLAAFVRIGAGLSGLALFGLLAVLWRRELVMRRRRATV